MPVLNLVASIAVSVFLVGLCLVLAGPAFDLSSFGPNGGLQSGTLPQFVVIAVTVLAVISAVSDIVKWRAGRRSGEVPVNTVAPVRQVVLIGGGVMAMLAAFVFTWRPLPFPLIAFVFFTVVGVILAPPPSRTLRGYGAIALTGLLFSGGVWLLFTSVLNVPLR